MSLESIITKLKNGEAIYMLPYKEPKVWGVGGIGEYWYGAETGEKSSIAVSGTDEAPMDKIIETDAKVVLGEDVIKKFGHMLPLVKILTPKGRLSVQFHDAKNELWIVTGVSADKATLIVGFSRKAVDKYKSEVTTEYGKALAIYGEKLNKLIELLEGSAEGKTALREVKDVRVAAEAMPDSAPVAEALKELDDAREGLEAFYNYLTVEPGDVIPIPSGTLHALGSGVEVVEPQIPGPTQSLEDGATYPVRYYFPGYEREGAQKKLDLGRVNEMNPAFTEHAAPEVIATGQGYTVERLPGKFEDKGLEVHRITLDEGAVFEMGSIRSYHSLTAVQCDARLNVGEKEYKIPKAVPGGEMLLVPASSGSFSITCAKKTQIIDTFTPVI